jgi:hypothetical protein
MATPNTTPTVFHGKDFRIIYNHIQNLWMFFCNYCFSKRICSWKIVTTNVQAKPHRVARFGKQLIINVKEVDLSCAFINTGDGSQSSNHRKIQHVPMWRIGGARLYIIRKSLPWNTVGVVAFVVTIFQEQILLEKQ